jgi:hypothetical protein
LQRYYTTAGFRGINGPLRDKKRRERKEQHKFAVLVYVLAEAIRKLRAWAGGGDGAHDSLELFRGMSNRQIFEAFMSQGGTEFAPMSTTAKLWVALKYSQGAAGNINTLLWLRTEGFMDRGVDLQWLSAFPHEEEFVYSPLAFVKPIRKNPILLEIGQSTYQVVECKIQMS